MVMDPVPPVDASMRPSKYEEFCFPLLIQVAWGRTFDSISELDQVRAASCRKYNPPPILIVHCKFVGEAQ